MTKEAKTNYRPWWYQPEIAALVLLFLGIYIVRLTALPIVGEEARWGGAAAQMVETGDWIVLRQQGQVFPERPPVSIWAIASVGLLRGGVDPIAVRLPSVLALLATSLLVYGYSRNFMTRFGSFTAAAVFATFGQVLQIGRHGETEALFTLFLSASLLVWHWGYAQRWPAVWTWVGGYACMATAMLTKGPQAPVYFVAVIGVYLLLRRDWRFLLSWSHAAGIATACVLVAAWQIPYFLATNVEAAITTWGGLATDRFRSGNFVEHLLTYPLETMGCLLPWSPMLFALGCRRVREELYLRKNYTTFVLISLIVTYPTIWLASEGRSRYFMPLYPCVAVLIGLIIERCADARAGTWARRNWINFVIGAAVFTTIAGAVVAASPFVSFGPWGTLFQPTWFAIAFALVGAGTAAVLLWGRHKTETFALHAAVFSFAAFCGLIYTGVITNIHIARWNDLTEQVAEARKNIPEPTKLVSFGPVHHRFCFYYGDFIHELPWPESTDDIPPDVEYFCIERQRGNTAEYRSVGRGRSWRSIPNKFPYQWEELASVVCDRQMSGDPLRQVVICKIKRDSSTAANSATARADQVKNSVQR